MIQEHLFPNEWLILVSCILLNCTSRTQVQKIIHHFVNDWYTTQLFLHESDTNIKNVIKSLGFVNRRFNRLKSLAQYIINNPTWSDPYKLPGIGQYGADAWQIFCNGNIPKHKPKDGSLTLYWEWYNKNAVSF